MAPPTPAFLLFVSVAVAVAALLPARAAGGRALLPEDACRTSSFPAVCMAMLGTVDYKSDVDVTLAMLKQSQSHIVQAVANANSVVAKGGGTAKQAQAARTCKGRYEQAAMDLEEAMKYFYLTPDITLAREVKKVEEAELWHRYTGHLMRAAKDVYDCAAAVEDSGEPAAPLLAETSGSIVRIMYTAYDLCTRTQEGI